MKVLLLLALAVAMVTIVVATDFIVGKGTAKGTFKYKGDECVWHEERDTGSIRSVNIKCGDKSYIKYLGDPHKCSWYKDDKQCEYYKCLIRALITANFNSISPTEVSCTKKKCGDVVFEKVSSQLLKVIMKKMNEEQEKVEIEEPECDEFDVITCN